jgi:hypothetical protein
MTNSQRPKACCAISELQVTRLGMASRIEGDLVNWKRTTPERHDGGTGLRVLLQKANER